MEAPRDELIWAGAIIDSEGCIYIKRSGMHPPKVTRYPAFNPGLYVGNTVLQMCLDLQKVFGGHVSARKTKAKPHHKQCFIWRSDGVRAAEILEVLRPFIRYKRAQADAVIALVREKRRFQSVPAGTSRHGTRITEEEYERRRSLYDLVKILNQTGVPATTEREDATVALDLAKRQSELHGNMQSASETNVLRPFERIEDAG